MGCLLSTVLFWFGDGIVEERATSIIGRSARGSRVSPPGCIGGLPEEECRGSENAVAYHGHINAVSSVQFLLY